MDYLVRLNLVTGGNQTVKTKGKEPREILRDWLEDGYIQTGEDEGTEIFVPWAAVVAFEFGPEAGAETVGQRPDAS